MNTLVSRSLMAKRNVTALCSMASLLAGTAWAVPFYTLTDLGTFGGTDSYSYGISNGGQIVGQARTTGEAAYHAFLWNGASKTDLGTLGGTSSSANGISNGGQIVGQANTTGDTAYHATFWNNSSSTLIDLGTLGGTNSYAFGINDSG